MRNLILACLIALCFGCSKNSDEKDIEYADIVGKWRYASLTGHLSYLVGADTIINPGDGCYADNTLEFKENKVMVIKSYYECNQTTEVLSLTVSKEHLDENSPVEPYFFSIDPKEGEGDFPLWLGKTIQYTDIVFIVSCTKTTLVYRMGYTFVTLKRVE